MLKYKIIATRVFPSSKTGKRSISFPKFYNINKAYYLHGVHSSGFPYDSIGSEGTKAPWSQPTSIGFYLQYLVNENNALEAEKVMNSLLKLQADPKISWNGLIPWLRFDGDTVLADRSEIAFGDNSNLSKKVAMVAQKFTGNAGILANQFLNNQKIGYQKMYDPSEGLLFGTVDRETNVFNNGYHINRLFNEFRAGVAFVVAYFDVNEKAWNNLLANTIIANYIDRKGNSINNGVACDGSGFQYSWPLLSLPEGELSADMKNVLYNALYAQLNTAFMQGHVGGYSACSVRVSEAIYSYSGKIGIPELAEISDAISAKTFSIYSLLPFLAILDKKDKQTLMKWITAYSEYPGIKGKYGYHDSVHDSPNGKVVSDLVLAIDNGSMILPKSQGPKLLMDFLDKHGKGDKLRDLYSRIKLSIPKTPKRLPPPPPQI